MVKILDDKLIALAVNNDLLDGFDERVDSIGLKLLRELDEVVVLVVVDDEDERS